MVSTVGSTGNNNTVSGGSTTIAENFEQFLGILLAQLQNQNPLEPLDTNQFTQQLVQFTEVEQSLKTNEQLGDIVENTASSEHINVINYVGSKITADGDITQLTAGDANWQVNAPETVSDVAVTIYNEGGSIVYQGTTNFTKGDNTFNWDGKDTVGKASLDGAYRVAFDAKSQAGRSVTLDTKLSGEVTGVDFGGLEPVLRVGDAKVPLSKISSVETIA